MKVFYFIGVRPANQQWKRRGGSIFYPRDHCKTLIRGRSDESRSFSGIPESRILFAFDVGGGPASIRSNYIHVRAHVHNFCWRSTPLPEAVTRSCMFHPAISLSLSIYLPTYLPLPTSHRKFPFYTASTAISEQLKACSGDIYVGTNCPLRRRNHLTVEGVIGQRAPKPQLVKAQRVFRASRLPNPTTVFPQRDFY